MSAPTPRPAGIPWCPCGQQKFFEWCSGCAAYVCRAPGHVHVCSNDNAPPGATGEASEVNPNRTKESPL